VSSGSSLGTVNATASRLAVLAINNAGTVELAVVNLAGGTLLDESNLLSTTAEGGAGAADSASTVYSTTARGSVPYRVVGFIESTQATAGTWATAPSTIQGVGGQALAALASLGYSQTWQDLTASRALATTYYNTTGRPIFVTATNAGSASNVSVTATVNGVVAAESLFAVGGNGGFVSFVVPPGATYSVTMSAGGLNRWSELR